MHRFGMKWSFLATFPVARIGQPEYAHRLKREKQSAPGDSKPFSSQEAVKGGSEVSPTNSTTN
jgi:hypothetical protein